MSTVIPAQPIRNYTVHKEHRADLFSVSAMNPFPGHISASRIQMFTSHLSQKLNIAEPTLRYIQTGMEYEFGKYTLNITMPHEAGIIKVIRRYNETMDKYSIPENPQDIVIYEDRESNKIHILDIPRFCSYHQHFGFEYVPQEAYETIRPGKQIKQGAVIVDAPSKAKNGGYMFARDIPVAFMSHESIAEDGIMICRDAVHKFAYKTYETRVVEWGAKKFPLNMYGTVDIFKAFPDIGDYVREDNVLMAFRTLDKTLAPVEQNVYEMMMINQNFDKVVYAANLDGCRGRIIDIKVQASSEAGTNTLEGTDEQIEKYKVATDIFYTKIYEEYTRLKKERGDNLKISDEFQRLLVEAQTAIKPLTNPKLIKLHKRVPIDDYRVEFTIEYTHIPRDGSKFTDCAGGKGVICKMAEPHEMPVDKHGRRADMVMDGGATINRSNYARFYEHYFNAVSFEVLLKVRQAFGLLPTDKTGEHKIRDVFYGNPALFKSMYDYVMGWYEIVSPFNYNKLVNADDEVRINHLTYITQPKFNGIHLTLPTDNPVSYSHAVQYLEQRPEYRPLRDKVQFMHGGKLVTSVNDVRIADLYIMLLEKTGDDWSAVSSGKLQNFGILAQITKGNKHSSPIRNQAIRAFGEAEIRNLVSYCGEEPTAEMIDRNNNPATHREVVRSILKAQFPTNIENAVDRKKVPLGGSKPLQIMHHMAMCLGWKFTYTPDPHLGVTYDQKGYEYAQ